LLDRIGDLHEHDRDRAGGLLDDRQVGGGGGQDHLRRQSDQLRRVGPRQRGVARIPANIDAEIAAFHPSQLTHGLHERRHVGLRQRLGGGTVHQHADAPRRAGLRARGERPKRRRRNRRAAEQRDELPSPHGSHPGQGKVGKISLRD